MNPMLIVAKQQFSDIVREPLVIIILLVLIILSFLNGAASMSLLPLSDIQLLDGNDHFLSVGLSNTLYHTSFLLTMLSMFIGVFTIAEERMGGSMSVLLTKPLYRRDVVGGKFAGLALFLFLVTAMIVMLCVSSIMVFYRGPTSFGEMVLRVSSYIIVLSLSSTLTLGISFLIGIFFKNIFEILLFNGIFLFLDWRYTLPQALNGLRFLIPAGLYTTIIDGVNQHYILKTNVPYDVWLSAAMPYILFMLFAIIAVFLFSCYVFNAQGRD
jgi:ABC-2 type transport system permease protein